MTTFPAAGILVEAEAFDDYGGWTLDSQFEMEMGSPYLLAHGNGNPVADATTTIAIPLPDSGVYKVWVRAKDWVPDSAVKAGRFHVVVDDTVLDHEFGTNGKDWSWELGGTVELPPGEVKLALRDLTGFCGRCDAIFLTLDDTPPPEYVEPVKEAARAWRRQFRGLPRDPAPGGSYDVIVVGGGLVGSAAALATARLGNRVALIQDRPYLGGNASIEVGLSPRGIRGPLMEEIVERPDGGDIKARQLLDAHPNAETLLEHTIYDTRTVDNVIVSVDARHARTGREVRLSAKQYIDCSGKCILGMLSGAETMSGREPQAQYGESHAPKRADNMHHGNTVFFRTRMADSPSSFPAVPWATQVAKDYSNLSGQLVTPGLENGKGPRAVSTGHIEDPNQIRRMKRPNTHYWEYGQWIDPYTQVGPSHASCLQMAGSTQVC
jgi:hypothetical protein